MNRKSKSELLEVVRPRYLKANKVEKQKILDEFTSATGYHRKHAIRVLKNKVQIQNLRWLLGSSAQKGEVKLFIL